MQKKIDRDTLNNFLYNRIDFESRTPTQADRELMGLKLVRKIMATTGISLPGRVLHVAGTNGKGSTCFYLEQGILAAGSTTGTFLSPHVESLTERFRINGEAVAMQDLLDGVNWLITRGENLLSGCTTFEILFLLAAILFTRFAVDFTILETGLGGRLDTTNVASPEATLITPVSLDHTGILGTTLTAIAREKAGIIKQGVPCFTAPQEPEVSELFAKSAAALGAPFIPAKSENYQYTGEGLSGGVYRDSNWTLFLRMPGYKQADNCHLALRCLAGLAVVPDPDALQERLRKNGLLARMEFSPGHPSILLDGGHNPAAAVALSDLIGNKYPRVFIICALQQDKETAAFLKIIETMGDLILLTITGSPRSASPRELAKQTTRPTLCLPDPEEALAAALARAKSSDLIIICGSFYLAGILRGKLTHNP